MNLPYKVLNAATATGAGTAFDLGEVGSKFTFQVIVTGAPSAVGAKLEGSLDGSTWFDLTGMALAAAGAKTNNDPAAVNLGVRFIRANVTTLTGGTSPTVSVWLARH